MTAELIDSFPGVFSCSALTRSVNCGAERAAAPGLSPGPPKWLWGQQPRVGGPGWDSVVSEPLPEGETAAQAHRPHVRSDADPSAPEGISPAHAHLQLLVLPLQVLQDKLQLVLVLALALTV